MALKPFFVLPLALPVVTSGNELATRPAEHLGLFYYRGMVWKSSGDTNLWVKIDFGTAKEIDFVGILSANALPGTTIRIRLGDSEAEVDAAGDYDSTALPFIDPSITRADGYYHAHHELPSVQTKRWMRIDIGGHTGDFEASMLIAGKKVQPFHYYEPQWGREIRDLGAITFSRNGVPGVNRGTKLRAVSYRLQWVTEAEMEEMMSPLDEAIGRTSPLFVCFDPEESIYRQRRTFFGFNEEQPEHTKQGYDRFQRDFRVLSLF